MRLKTFAYNFKCIVSVEAPVRFCAKIDSIPLIDYLGDKLGKLWGSIFSSHGLLMKTTPLLCLSDTLNINKALLPVGNDIFALQFTIQISFEGVFNVTEKACGIH